MAALSILTALLSCAVAAGAPGAGAPVPPMPFQNPDLPLAARVNDLVGRLTLNEKVSQMMNTAPGIPRLGIPAYEWWHEALHGVVESGSSTVFPQAIGLAACWDASLHHSIATAISDEARGKFNEAAGRGEIGWQYGLDFWAPNINIFRDPRWGRGQETCGEDPFLTSTLAVAFVTGMQGDDPHYWKTVATPKHFAVHSGPEMLRHQFDAIVSPYDLYDTYLPGFQAAVQRGHAHSVMGAYSALYGVPDCANPLLLRTNLKDRWGFDGYVVSDCGAIGDISGGHHYVPDLPAAAALAVKAGCDLCCGGEYHALPAAVQRGLITEAEIDASVKRLFMARMRMGLFDPPSSVPYSKIPFSTVDSASHRQLALRAARESIVLLKNEGGLLPLRHTVRSIAVIGPNADSGSVLLGNYHGQPSRVVTVLQGIQQRAGAGVRVEYEKGVDLQENTRGLAVVPQTALRAGGQPGLHAEFFSNETLTGGPVITRQDPQVDFNWSDRSPGPGLTNMHFSARWTGDLIAPKDGQVVLAMRGDDGFRLFVNGQLVIDDWGIHPAQTRLAHVTVRAGQPTPIRLEYYQATGESEVSLRWGLPTPQPFGPALDLARRSDVVVFVGGISASIEGEEGTNGNGDRTDLALPAPQQALLRALSALGKPIVLVLMSGSNMGVPWAQEHLPAILEAWYGGEEGGTAVANVLFGDTNPSGRLPITFYRSVDQLPPFTDYAMKNRTYRYFTGQPLYRFGDGLSYTRFSYSGLKAPRRVAAGRAVSISVRVRNTGERAGDEVVELYLRPLPGPEARRMIASGQPMPRLELAGFQRLSLAPGQSRTASFTLRPEQLLLVNAHGVRSLQPGRWEVFVGGHQPDLSGRPTGTVSSVVTVGR